MLYTQPAFTLPTNTKEMSKELFAYRVGLIDLKEFIRLTGHKPEEEEQSAV
jgi:hypothetical protein